MTTTYAQFKESLGIKAIEMVAAGEKEQWANSYTETAEGIINVFCASSVWETIEASTEIEAKELEVSEKEAAKDIIAKYQLFLPAKSLGAK